MLLCAIGLVEIWRRIAADNAISENLRRSSLFQSCLTLSHRQGGQRLDARPVARYSPGDGFQAPSIPQSRPAQGFSFILPCAGLAMHYPRTCGNVAFARIGGVLPNPALSRWRATKTGTITVTCAQSVFPALTYGRFPVVCGL